MKSQFQLKQPNVIYKVKYGSGATISNDKMTDELAIEFIKVKPTRLELFSIYPENIDELLNEQPVEALPVPQITTTTKKSCKSCKDKTISSKKTTPKRTVKKVLKK